MERWSAIYTAKGQPTFMKIVSNNGSAEVHSIWIDDSNISIVEIATGNSVSLKTFEKEFPNFQEALDGAQTTETVLIKLGLCNSDYI